MATLKSVWKKASWWYLLVEFEIDTIQLTEADEIGPNENLEFLAFHFPLFPFPRVTLVLKANPELVHFGKVVNDKGNWFSGGQTIRDLPCQ